MAVDPGVFRLTNGGAGEVVEEIGRDFSATGEILVSGRGKVYGCGVDAEVELMGDASVVRLVLVDRGGRRYLVLESESAMNGRGRHGFDRHCEETCGLAGVEPMKVVVQVEQARVKVRRLYWVMRDMGKNKAELSKRQHEWKVAKLNERAETWRAGLTPQGCLSYEEKCRLFRGAEGSGLLPNLQGMEYYAGGLYTLRTNPPREARRRPPAWPPRMNWRLRHGYRLLTPVKDRGIGGESEAYALVAALECNLNIFYNQHLDVTLAEEDLVELSGAWGGNGVDVLRAVQYCHESGVIPTGCVVRSGGQGGEVRRCEDWKEWVVRSGGGYVTNGISNDELRRLLVRYGVIPVGVPEWEEMVVVVGWETNAYGEGAVWVVRSSFGPRWGDEGYMWLSCDAGVFAPVVVLTTPYEWGRRQIKTVCNDSDGDKYCAWGIAPVLPRSCCSCSCRSVQDFDDYDPQQGPHYPLN
ncbi:MAG: hypothetical protein N2595_03010 [bacterium]|nr:hypothetical protein [bacterium]